MTVSHSERSCNYRHLPKYQSCRLTQYQDFFERRDVRTEINSIRSSYRQNVGGGVGYTELRFWPLKPKPSEAYTQRDQSHLHTSVIFVAL